MPEQPSEPPSRLVRRMGLGDAVVMGLGGMLGAGVFAAFAPASAAAGSGLLAGLGVAAVIAYCNAMCSARLAARYPESGGAYVYAGRRLGPWWGYLAGSCFVVGKLASCAAIALVFGAYVLPDAPRWPAIVAVIAVAALNDRGLAKTLTATRVILAVVVAALAAVVVGAVVGGGADADRLLPIAGSGGVRGILEAAGFLFFAFAGYARVATLGEEVRDPRRTIPRAIPVALVGALVVYALVAVAILVAIGAPAIAVSDQPLAAAVAAGGLSQLEPLVRVGAAVACLGVLVSLLAGVARTAFAMAARGDLPRTLAVIDPAKAIPRRAGWAAAAVVVAVVSTADLRDAIGWSSVLVLLYYALGDGSALTLGRGRWWAGRGVAALGVALCIVVATALPQEYFVPAVGVLIVAVVFRFTRRRRPARRSAGRGSP